MILYTTSRDTISGWVRYVFTGKTAQKTPPTVFELSLHSSLHSLLCRVYSVQRMWNRP